MEVFWTSIAPDWVPIHFNRSNSLCSHHSRLIETHNYMASMLHIHLTDCTTRLDFAGQGTNEGSDAWIRITSFSAEAVLGSPIRRQYETIFMKCIKQRFGELTLKSMQGLCSARSVFRRKEFKPWRKWSLGHGDWGGRDKCKLRLRGYEGFSQLSLLIILIREKCQPFLTGHMVWIMVPDSHRGCELLCAVCCFVWDSVKKW